MLLFNVLITIVWCWLQGSFSAGNVVGGFALGFVSLGLLSRTEIIRGRDYFKQVPQVLGLFFYFLWALVVANLRLAYDLLTPGIDTQPAIVAMPLDAQTDAEITLVASLISLTPGTLSMDVSPDRKVLYIHAMYANNPDELIASLKNGFEKRVLEVLR